ncbi:hypothetical protein [Streptomyces sp. NBC_01013]|nr:hypothetical protein OG538_00455 [Streptomyces sp. NBC_01013]
MSLWQGSRVLEPLGRQCTVGSLCTGAVHVEHGLELLPASRMQPATA